MSNESDLQKQIDDLKSRLTELNQKLTTIVGNQKHYLRHRAPAVLKNQQIRILQAQRLLKRIEAIPNLKVITSYKGKVRAQRSLFMCTGNEARKLRSMLNIDFRQFNSSKAKKLHDRMNYSHK